MRKISVLRLTLHDTLVGYLIGSQDGRNSLVFDDAFKTHPSRPSLSLITRPDFPQVEKLLAKPWLSNQRLHPLLSNLLPEGALRELIAQGLKTHTDNEFQLFSYLGLDLPGALIAEPLAPEEVPSSIIASDLEILPINPAITENCSGLIKTDTLNRLINLNQLKQGPSKNETKTPSIR